MSLFFPKIMFIYGNKVSKRTPSNTILVIFVCYFFVCLYNDLIQYSRLTELIKYFINNWAIYYTGLFISP